MKQLSLAVLVLALSMGAIKADTLPTGNVPAAAIGNEATSTRVVGAPETTQPGTVAPGVSSGVAQGTVPVAPGATTAQMGARAVAGTAAAPVPGTAVPGTAGTRDALTAQEPVIINSVEEGGMPMPSGRPSQMTPSAGVQPRI